MMCHALLQYPSVRQITLMFVKYVTFHARFTKIFRDATNNRYILLTTHDVLFTSTWNLSNHKLNFYVKEVWKTFDIVKRNYKYTFEQTCVGLSPIGDRFDTWNISKITSHNLTTSCQFKFWGETLVLMTSQTGAPNFLADTPDFD